MRHLLDQPSLACDRTVWPRGGLLHLRSPSFYLPSLPRRCLLGASRLPLKVERAKGLRALREAHARVMQTLVKVSVTENATRCGIEIELGLVALPHKTRVE